jgi:glycosyltransferase involved in cell wall biosynthesis
MTFDPLADVSPAAGQTSSGPAATEGVQRVALELTILMPCLDEVETVGRCVAKACAFLDRANIAGEVVVADNGSTDGSQRAAANAGARVVQVSARGYGSALIGGIEAARGRFIVMGDSDDSYDFGALEAFVERLRQGDQLVMGNRFAGGIARGAMPALHRYLGNPVLSFIGRLLFRSRIGDFHCGLRGFERDAIRRLALASSGMEFASEMIVKAELAKLRISEVPTTLAPDGRSRPPHLRSFRDGWRHLRFLLMMSPRWLLLYPGLCLLFAGFVAQLAILRGPVVISGVGFDVHTMLYAAGASILGLQLVVFALLAAAIGSVKGVLPMTSTMRTWLGRFTLERGILTGLVIGLAGLGLAIHSVNLWFDAHLAALDPTAMMRYAIPSVTLMIAGAEVLFASFVLSFIEPLRPHRGAV